MIKVFCKKHPQYIAKKPPKNCSACWAIYDLIHKFDSSRPVDLKAKVM